MEYVHENGTQPGRLYVNAAGRVTGIWFGAPVRREDSLAQILTELEALSGATALTVREDGALPLVAYHSTEPLAVGSTFKLAILKTLVDRVAAGKARWSDTLALREEQVSLPSGMLQDWPAGAPLTLHTLATLMVSISDNTATDLLLAHLGREAVELASPARNRPFLSTREMFTLKSRGNEALAERYAQAPEAERRKILARLADPPHSRLQPHTEPRHVRDIEWFFSTDELCTLMLSLKAADVLGVNRGLVAKDSWARTVRYKGGSEPGVLNLTHALQRRPGDPWYCVSATWNDPDGHLDEEAFSSLVVRAINVLGKR